jgi:hypothetical protein
MCLILILSEQAPAARPDSLSDLLATSPKGEIREKLHKWDKDLSEEDIAVLEAFIQETRHKDWALNYYARLLLRRKVPGRYQVSAAVEQAEAILARMVQTMGYDRQYDRFIPELVELGRNITELLLDVLEYEGEFDTIRKENAMKALGMIDDPGSSQPSSIAWPRKDGITGLGWNCKPF